MSGIGRNESPSISGRSSSGSLVNLDVYWIFRASAFSVESLIMMLSGFRDAALSGFLLFDIAVYLLWIFCDVRIKYCLCSLCGHFPVIL